MRSGRTQFVRFAIEKDDGSLESRYDDNRDEWYELHFVSKINAEEYIGNIPHKLAKKMRVVELQEVCERVSAPTLEGPFDGIRHDR